MKLSSSVLEIPLVGNKYSTKLEKLDIYTVEDLLHHIPLRYLDFRTKTQIEKVQQGDTITVKGEIVNVDNVFTFRSKNFQLIEIQDSTGKIQAVWFNQPYLTRTLKKGVEVSLSGK